MIVVTRESALLLSGTSRLICLRSLERGWTVRTPYLACPHYFIDRGDGREIHIFSATPPTVSYASAQLVNNKYATSVVLADVGIVQLPIMLLDTNLSQLEQAMRFIHDHGPTVVKPIDGSHGKGITVGVDSKSELLRSHRYALKNTYTMRSTVMQKQLVASELHDIRIAVLNGKVVGAIERIPARIKGDGLHTVAQLIEIENQQEYRGEPYRSKLARIDIKRATTYLGGAIESVPADGQWYSVMAVANYGAGGELVDVTDDIPSWMHDESIRAAHTLGLDVAGVDYLLDRAVHATLERDESQSVIVEVNKSPALSIHDEPTVGINRRVTEAYLDFIATL